MNYNEDYPSDIHALMPKGTNSTMFTRCCNKAICNDEPNCPSCKRPVIGHDAQTEHERGMIRWRSATAHWNRNEM